MNQRALGTSGLTVSSIGLGCMVMSSVYGPADPDQARATLTRALDLGITFWDTAEIYGNGANEELLAPMLAAHRDDITIATKFGFESDGSVSAGPDQARRAIDGSLRRLGVDHIDLWYVHRVDPTLPIEETIGAMAEIVAAGKVRHLGLCEASSTTLRRAHATHPIAAVQSEWSLWSRDLESEVAPVARALGIGIVPYSPLGRGMLTGGLSSTADLAANDHRRSGPRFSAENFEHNRSIVERLQAAASVRGCTAAQLALAWLLAQGEDVVPIPGTKSPDHLAANAEAARMVLARDEVDEIADLMQGFHGDRYGRPHAYGETPPQD